MGCCDNSNEKTKSKQVSSESKKKNSWLIWTGIVVAILLVLSFF